MSMKPWDLVQALWLSLLLSGAVYAGGTPSTPHTSQSAPDPHSPPVATLRDAQGHQLPPQRYERIASTSGYADELLLALAEPERISALSSQGRRTSSDAFRYGSRPLLGGSSDLEQLLSLRVDLLLVNRYAAANDLARARDAGIQVFDLGQMRGLSSLRDAIYAVASLLGDPARGQRLWQRFSLELAAVARDIPQARRRGAAYVAIYANKLYGGTRGSSYHDVLEAAGLRDVAAEHFRDWPQYDPEQLLELDPPLIITEAGMAAQICELAWSRSLRACRSDNSGRRPGMVEVSHNLMGSAGLGMLDAALELRALVYPPAR